MDDALTGRVLEIIAAVKKVSPGSLSADSSFEELGIDSLDRINILFELESAFDIQVPDDEARSITSIRDIITRLDRYLQVREASGA